MFLILVDVHSKWVDIYHTRGSSSKDVISSLRHSFSTFGLPASLVSDNGQCFYYQEFKDFVNAIGIRYVTTDVCKPSTNRLAEKIVQTFKRTLRSSSASVDVIIDRFSINYRTIPTLLPECLPRN